MHSAGAGAGAGDDETSEKRSNRFARRAFSVINEQLDGIAGEDASAKGGKQSLADSEAVDVDEEMKFLKCTVGDWSGKVPAIFSETRSLRRLTCKLTNDDIVWL